MKRDKYGNYKPADRKKGPAIRLEWVPATGVTMTDGAPNPIVGYRVWVAEDTVPDCDFPPPDTGEFRPLKTVPYRDTQDELTTSTLFPLEDLDPQAESVQFALQLLYQSPESPSGIPERRSGFIFPDGVRVEGLSANSNRLMLNKKCGK
jgi:hypothetical protein